MADIDYSQYGAEPESGEIDYSQYGAVPENVDSKLSSRRDQMESILGVHRTPVDTLRDLAQGALSGLGKGGQFIANKLTRGYAPQVNFDELLSSVGSPRQSMGGQVAKGIGEYAPYGMAGGGSLLGQLGAGGVFGAATTPSDEMGGAIKGSLINALTHGAFKGLEALRPSRMLRGALSPEELKSNLQAARETSTALGDVIESPMLKRQYENILSKLPFSGATKKLQQAGLDVEKRGNNILNELLGENSPDTVTDQIHNSLMKQHKIHELEKNNLYDNVNNIADSINLKLELPSFSKKAQDYSAAIENTNMLKYEPDVQRIFNKLQNYKSPTQELEGKILSTSGEPLSKEIKYPTLQEANLLKGKLNNYAKMAKSSPDPSQRNLSKVFGSLASSLKSDINSSIDQSGHELLKSSYKKAEENYAKNFSPFLDKEIYKFTHGNADPDTIAQTFVKVSRGADRSKALSKLTSKLPDKEQSLLGYAYFSRALDNEGNFNPGKLSTLIKNLGKNQLKALVPDVNTRNSLLNYNRLYKMNPKAVKLMENPATGQQALDVIPGLLAHAGTSMAGGALGGLPGAMAGLVAPGLVSRPLVNWLTSPVAREKLVNAMIENKPWNRNALTGMQSLIQGNQNQ